MKWRHALRHPTQSKAKMDQESSRVEPRTRQFYQHPKESGRLAKRWEDDLNDFVKAEATETTQSNDLKNDTTWF